MKKIILLSSMIIFSLSAKTIEELNKQCEESCKIHQPCVDDKVNANIQDCINRKKQYNECLANCKLFKEGLTECQKSITTISNEIDKAQNQARSTSKFKCWPKFINETSLPGLFSARYTQNCKNLNMHITNLKNNLLGC